MQLRFGIVVIIACQPFTSQCQMRSLSLRPVQLFHFSWLSNDQIRSYCKNAFLAKGTDWVCCKACGW